MKKTSQLLLVNLFFINFTIFPMSSIRKNACRSIIRMQTRAPHGGTISDQSNLIKTLYSGNSPSDFEVSITGNPAKFDELDFAVKKSLIDLEHLSSYLDSNAAKKRKNKVEKLEEYKLHLKTLFNAIEKKLTKLQNKEDSSI